MFNIVEKEILHPEAIRLVIEAPEIACAYKPGQFVILRVDDAGERIPLTVVKPDLERGTIELIFQVVGASTWKLSKLNKGGELCDLVGPLGRPTHIGKHGRVVAIGGGLGLAALFPIVKALRDAGNEVISIIGARNLKLLLLQDDFASLSDKILVMTDDGSAGAKGFVTHALLGLLESKEKIDFAIAVGPLVMMKAVCDVTRKYNVKTMVSLNPIMVDGTGMCGVCRCTVKGETRFACVHGPEFDGWEVDFDELMRRQAMYKAQEKLSYDKVKKNHKCKCEG